MGGGGGKEAELLRLVTDVLADTEADEPPREVLEVLERE
jgi:hypothetical protein